MLCHHSELWFLPNNVYRNWRLIFQLNQRHIISPQYTLHSRSYNKNFYLFNKLIKFNYLRVWGTWSTRDNTRFISSQHSYIRLLYTQRYQRKEIKQIWWRSLRVYYYYMRIYIEENVMRGVADDANKIVKIFMCVSSSYILYIYLTYELGTGKTIR